MYRSEALETKLSKLFHRAFGSDLIVNRLGGSEITLHIGERPTLSPGEHLTSEGYIQRVEALPMVHTQGDGYRSFSGIMLRAFTGEESVLIIDEPEAFLHPPQASLMGQFLVKESPSYRQMFLATHSGDFLRGVINSDSKRVHVLRIRRTDDGNNAIARLDQAHIRKFWTDPLLRYSNALDGLFHERVVVCEADSDCRFYGAMAATLAESGAAGPRLDAMFVHCGGKHRIPTLVRALRSLDVPIRAVADFDVLQDEHPLRAIVEALGGSWTLFESDWKTVKSAIDAKKPELLTADVRKEIENEFARVSDRTVPRTTANNIKAILRRSTAWSIAKETGEAYVPGGQIRAKYDLLLSNLRSLGLHIVEVGELEAFDRRCSGHGPEWVNQALEKDLLKDPALGKARAFVEQLMA